MVKFSVCLIAKNEAANLWRLHNSLTEFQKRGGEVVLVDTGSTDNTPEVARGLGFNVFEVGERFIQKIPENLAKSINDRFVVPGEEPIVKAGDKLFDYSAARNYSARMANNDVVSMPDCDEQYTNLNIDEIEKVIAQGFQQMEFHFIFAHYPNGQPAVQFRQCKMYDRRIMHWQGIVHEVLVGNAKRTYLPPPVLLLEHFQAPQTHRSRYLAGLSLDCYLNQDNDRNSHYLGRELLWNGRPKSAIRELTRHVGMNRWQQERGQSMIFIGDAHMAIGQEERGIESWHKAIQIDDTRREPWLRLADYYWKKNNPQRVACYCMAALEIPPNDCYCNVGAHYTFEPHEKLYWALWWMGQRERSKEHWRKAFAYDPSNPKYIADKQFYEPTSYDYKLPGGGGAAEGAGIDGWMTHGELEWLYHQAQKVDSILELGSWKGRSTHALLSGCKGTVTAVDTWKGSADPRDMTNAQAKRMDILAEFKKNVGHFKNLEIVQMDSADAAAKFREEGRKFDMVFIDAGHTYEEVKRDIEMWRPFAKVILSGHDYLPQTWMGVCQAVDECCGRTYKAESIWYTPAEPFPQIKGKYFEDRLAMQEKIEAFEPFSYVKWNDGEQQCIEGVEGATCDGQPYSYELNLALRKAYNLLTTLPDVYISDWKEWRDDNLNDGGILLHREKRDLQPLHDFYMAIKRSPRRKIFVGPAKLCTQVGRLLDCNYIEVPEKDAFAKYDDILARLKSITTDLSIIMLSCGLISKPLIADILKHNPKVTCLDTGSSFDPIFLGATRTLQAPQKDLLALYADMLGNEGLEKGMGCGLPTITPFPQRIPKSIFTIWLSEKEGLPPIVEKCVETQKAVEGYEHRVLTLADVPKDIPYLDAALAAKKWVKAADYLRIWWLKEHGGIYCDSDMEILPGKNFDALLDSSLFICREENGFVANSLIGAEPGNQVCIEHLSEVESRFKGDDDNIFQAAQEILTPRVLNASTLNPSIKVLSADYFIPYNHQNGTIKVTDNTIAFHHFVKAWITESYTKDFLPRIAILIPSLGRPEGLQRCLRSIDRLYYPKHLLKVVVDEGEGTVPQKVNRMARGNPDVDAYVYAANDMEFEPWSLYRIVKEAQGNPPDPHPFEIPPAMPFLYGLVSFNAGPVYPDEGNICEHFFISKPLFDEFGEVFSEKFHHVGCDNLLWAKAKKLQQAHHSEAAKIAHRHFSRGADMDEVYHKGWSNVDNDRRVLAEELEKLKNPA
jgi:glycosyltransferase involved in cell wall biosynthesis